MHRELAEGRVDDVVLQRVVPVEDDAHHGEQHQQHREDGEEGGMGDLGGQAPGLIVGVLADHRARHGGGPVPLLEAVGPVEAPGRTGGRGHADHRLTDAARPGRRSPTDQARPDR